MSNRKSTTTELKIRGLNLPENVRVLALKALDEIQQEFKTRSFKQRVQARVIFSCVMKAYFNMGIVADPKFIVKKLGLEKSKISIDKTLNLYLPDLHPNIFNLTAFYIDRYYQLKEDCELDREELLENIYEFINSCKEETEDNKETIAWLNNNYLTNVVIGITTFYMCEISQHSDFCFKTWSKSCELTTCCINKYKKSFEECYNS